MVLLSLYLIQRFPLFLPIFLNFSAFPARQETPRGAYHSQLGKIALCSISKFGSTKQVQVLPLVVNNGFKPCIW